MSKTGKILGKASSKFHKWLRSQRARKIASRSDGMVFVFAAGAGLISATSTLLVKSVFPDYVKLTNLWLIMPLKIKVATVLISGLMLGWSLIAFSFGLLCAFYSKELIRRLET